VKNIQALPELEAERILQVESLQRYLFLAVVGTIVCNVYYMFVVKDRSDAEVAALAAICAAFALPAYMQADQYWTSSARAKAAKRSSCSSSRSSDAAGADNCRSWGFAQ
jgi:hypothetical protein